MSRFVTFLRESWELLTVPGATQARHVARALRARPHAWKWIVMAVGHSVHVSVKKPINGLDDYQEMTVHLDQVTPEQALLTLGRHMDNAEMLYGI